MISLLLVTALSLLGIRSRTSLFSQMIIEPLNIVKMSGFYINNLLCYYSFYMSFICHLLILLTHLKRPNTVQISHIWQVVKISRLGWGKTVWSLSSNQLFSQWTPLTQRGSQMKQSTLRPKSVWSADRVVICGGFPVCDFPLRTHSAVMNAITKAENHHQICLHCSVNLLSVSFPSEQLLNGSHI